MDEYLIFPLTREPVSLLFIPYYRTRSSRSLDHPLDVNWGSWRNVLPLFRRTNLLVLHRASLRRQTGPEGVQTKVECLV